MKLFNLLIASLLLISSTAFSKNDDSLKIGVVLPLSGPLTKVGEAARNSINLADKQFDVQDKIEFVYEDDAYTPKNTISAVQKLINSDKVNGLIIFGSGPSLSVSKIAEKNKIPMIAISTADVTKGYKYVMRHWLGAKIVIAATLKEVEKREYDSIAVLTTENDAALLMHENFISNTKSKILLDQKFNPEDNDFKAIATRVKTLNPSAVFLILVPPQLGVLAKQLRALGYEGEFFSPDFIEAEEIVHEKDNVLIDTWYAASDDRGKRAREFFDNYRKQYNLEPIAGCSNSYDIAKLFIEGANTSNINKYLHTVKNFEGSLGVYSADNEGGFDLNAAIKVVTAKGLKYLNEKSNS